MMPAMIERTAAGSSGAWKWGPGAGTLVDVGSANFVCIIVVWRDRTRI
jgi:hypothetical protein